MHPKTVLLGAMLAAVVSGLVLLALGEPAPRPASDGKVETFRELGFRFRSPGDPWIVQDPKSLNKVAVYALRRPMPGRIFLVIAERLDHNTMSASDLADFALDRMKPNAKDLDLRSRTTQRSGPAHGVRLEYDATVGGNRLAYVHWCGVHGNGLYQLMWWGHPDDRSGLHQDAAELFSSFEILN